MSETKTKKSHFFKKIIIAIGGIIGFIIVLIILFFVYISSLLGSTRENMHKESMITEIGIEQEDGWYTYKMGFTESPKTLDKQYTLKSLEEFDETVHNYSSIKISSKDYPRITICYNYRNYLYLNLDFEDGLIKDWSVIDKKTKKDLGKLDYTGVDERYDFTEKYETIKLDPKDVYNLSELEENIIYDVSLRMDEDFLTSINNDLDYPVIVHKKGFSDDALEIFKPNIYLQNMKDKGWPKTKGYAVFRYFVFQKADVEDLKSFIK